MSSWAQRSIGAVMLIVLAGLPVMATTCEAFCDRPVAPALTGKAAEMSTPDRTDGCHESSTPADQRITGTSTHDCRTHDDGLRETEAALTSGRTDIGVLFVADTVACAPVVFASSSIRALEGYSPRQGIAPSHAPLVLRV